MNYSRVLPKISGRSVASGGAIFSLYAANLRICLGKEVFAVPDTLKAMSQLLQVCQGKPLLLYVVDRRMLCHAEWTAASEPYFDDTLLGFEEGVFPFRVSIESALADVHVLPIAEAEREIHGRDYRIGLDRSAFKAASVYWISPGQLRGLLALPAWRKSVSLRMRTQQKAPVPGRREALRPPRVQGNWEHRLMLLMQRHLPWLSAVVGEPLVFVDSYHLLTAANFLRSGCMGAEHSASIFDAQGEVDLLLSSRDGKTLYVFELKCRQVDNAAVRQLANYLEPIPRLPAFCGFERIVPVWVGASFSRKLNTGCLSAHSKIQPPLWMTLDVQRLRADDWWGLTPEDLNWRVFRQSSGFTGVRNAG